MAYALEFLPSAQDDLDQLDPPIARRLIVKLRWFAARPDPLRYGCPLHPPLDGDVRFRVGDYRAIAYVDRRRSRLTVAAIGHRRDIYQR